MYRAPILRWHLVPAFKGREWFVSQVSLIIDLCCPRPAWIIHVPASHGLQEEQQSSSSTAGRIAPFSVLALPLFSIAHIYFFLPGLNHLNWNFSCLLSLLFGKTKWFSSFGVWARENMCCFPHTEKLCWPTPPCPLFPVVLCCGV